MNFVGRYLDPLVVERLNALQLSARSVVEGMTTGTHRSPVKGASVEFRQHRFYVRGDEPRRLDWRVLGRTDRLYVKEYDEETNLRCLLLLDCSGSMGYGRERDGGSKFDYAARLTAALAYLMLAQTESVGLGLFHQRIDPYLAPRSGTAQLSRLLTLLDRTSPRSTASPAAALRDAGRRLSRRALLIVLSDFFCPVAELRHALALLRHDYHEVIVLRILDRAEIVFPFSGWSCFRGLEREPMRWVEPALLRQGYRGRFAAHAGALADACRSTRAEFHNLVTDQPLLDSLTAFLARRAGQ